MKSKQRGVTVRNPVARAMAQRSGAGSHRKPWKSTRREGKVALSKEM